MKDKIVKSVGRVFEILELFSRERRALSAIEVSRELGYPHTSTLAILKSIEALGYLRYEVDSRSFVPSENITQVVEWIVTRLHDEHAILGVMSDLHFDVDETVNLSRHIGNFVKIVHGIESPQSPSVRVANGVLMPLTTSHTGMVALATYPDDKIKRILHGLQQRSDSNTETADIAEVMERVHQIRRDKLSCGYDVYIKGIGVVCFALCSQTSTRPFVVAVAGPTDRIRAKQATIMRAAKQAIKKHQARLAYPI